MKNGQNTDLNNQNNIEFAGPLKARKWPRINLPMEKTNFYVHKYRDTNLNTELGEIKTYTCFLYKNHFYKNNEAQIAEKLRIS